MLKQTISGHIGFLLVNQNDHVQNSEIVPKNLTTFKKFKNNTNHVSVVFLSKHSFSLHASRSLKYPCQKTNVSFLASHSITNILYRSPLNSPGPLSLWRNQFYALPWLSKCSHDLRKHSMNTDASLPGILGRMAYWYILKCLKLLDDFHILQKTKIYISLQHGYCLKVSKDQEKNILFHAKKVLHELFFNYEVYKEKYFIMH